MGQLQQLYLIHGHGVDASIWDGVYADLVFEALVYTPNFADRTDLLSIEAYADALYQSMQPTEAEQVVLVGHSMGGYIALAFAQTYPERIRGLVLYHSTAKADDEVRRQGRAGVIKRLKRQGTAAFIQEQLPKMVAPTYPPAQTQRLIERFGQLPADALVTGLAAIAARPDRTEVLQRATYPILLILGRQDQLLAYDQVRQLSQLSDQIRVTTIEESGHLSMVEQPRQASEVLRSFLQSL